MTPTALSQARKLALADLSDDQAAALATLRGALAGVFRGQPREVGEAFALAALAVIAAEALLPAQRDALTAPATAVLARLGERSHLAVVS